jgi:hypothetical protein
VGDNGPIDATLKVLSDGLGTNLPMEASTTGVNFTGTTTVSGVVVANTTQLATKQDTLVSGTNIKTINSTSILGSGNISVVTSPSGVSGAIQFSDGSAFSSDAANLFWNDTNNRLGIGTNTPTRTLEVRGDALIQNVSGTDGSLKVGSNNGGINISSSNRSELSLQANAFMTTRGTGITFRTTSGEPLTAALGVIGSGSTSATTSLLVQNSSAVNLLSVNDAGSFSTTTSNFSSVISNDSNSLQVTGSVAAIRVGTSITIEASAILQADSTTKGFLPPRMTTTQRNAIASPATGLVLYDSTTNKLQCYNGSTWNDLF